MLAAVITFDRPFHGDLTFSSFACLLLVRALFSILVQQ